MRHANSYRAARRNAARTSMTQLYGQWVRGLVWWRKSMTYSRQRSGTITKDPQR